ncbi:MAG: BBP7 family outer membrane beta-barrel protein [Planctomycetota bacterium]
MRKRKIRLIFGLLILGGLVVHGRGAAGQELLIPPSGEGLSLGSGTRESLPTIELPDTPSTGGPSTGFEPIAEPIITGELQPSVETLAEGEEMRVFDYQPAVLESTGTWLRRGFWFAEVDALLMDRLWRRDDLMLGFQLNATGTTSNEIFLSGGRNGAEGMPRVKLGRFLFRDHGNRDHTAEFVMSGGAQWSTGGQVAATNGGTLVVDPILTGAAFITPPLNTGASAPGVNPSFTGATSMEYEYDSRVNNVELNYHVKSRMKKDRMEMDPSGRWVRRGQPSITRTLIAGIRYLDVNEDFDWNAFGIDADGNAATAAETGTYRIRTDNDLIGTQLGFSWNYERPRWSLGLKNKSGLYLNHTNIESDFEVTGDVTSGDNEITTDNISFLVEGALVGKYHVRQNFSIRVGFEALYVSSLALAPDQINFAPVNTIDNVGNGDSVYLGGLIGFEGYW